jgi:hypothetical protein
MLTRFQSDQSRADHTFVASVYILWFINYQRVSKESLKIFSAWSSLGLSLLIRFKKGYECECLQGIMWVKYNLRFSLQADKGEWHNGSEFSVCCTASCSKTSVIKREIIFRFYLLKPGLRCRYSDWLGLDDRGVGVRVPVGSRIFSSPRSPPNLLSNGYQG